MKRNAKLIAIALIIARRFLYVLLFFVFSLIYINKDKKINMIEYRIKIAYDLFVG